MIERSLRRLILRIFICTMLVSIFSGAVLADVIWEPNDDFYFSHYEDCEYVNRDYYANGKTGYLEVFKKPGGGSLGFADNGELFHIQFSYLSGDEKWGVIEFFKSEGKLLPADYNSDVKTGWVKMSDLVVKYDYISFKDEHGGSFVKYEGDYETLKDADKIVMWTYPGSGNSSGTFDEIDENFTIESVYIDENEVNWGYVGYHYGMRNFWICLNDPSNEDLAATISQKIDFYAPAPGETPTKSNDITTIVIICVAAVVIISAVLILVLKKKVRE